MAEKRQLTKTEKLGRRLQNYLYATLIFFFFLLLFSVFMHWTRDPRNLMFFLFGTYLLLAGIIGFKTKTALGPVFDFEYGWVAILVSTFQIVAALIIYLLTFSLLTL